MEKGLVSVITPCFNAAEFIEETVASVQAQHYSEWEMLIADDGSTDETAEIVARLMRDEPRIQFFPVGGESGLPARGRNAAMKRARGEYYALLEADDLWVPKKLERQVAYLRAHPEADGVCCWFDTFGDPGRVRLEQFRMMTSPVAQLLGIFGDYIG